MRELIANTFAVSAILLLITVAGWFISTKFLGIARALKEGPNTKYFIKLLVYGLTVTGLWISLGFYYGWGAWFFGTLLVVVIQIPLIPKMVDMSLAIMFKEKK